MDKKLLRPKKIWIFLLLPLAFLSFKVVELFQPGLDTIVAITPFMNGNLPSEQAEEEIIIQEIHTQLEWESPQAALPFPGTNKLLVVEMDGRFYTLDDNDDATSRTLVMDIQDRCWYYDWNSAGNKHGGFQNVVFHPDFGKGVDQDYIYVYYLFKTLNDDSDNSAPYYDRLSRFTWTGSSFDPDSELIMINQYDTAKGHDGGGLAFGNDGFLYVTVGDEGTQKAAATAHTQTINDRFRSGVWRIDVDEQGGTVSHAIERQPNNANVPAGADPSYTQGYYVPNDNPWVTGTGENLEEFYALGLRQPFRMTYDAPTGNFWIGDVGASSVEEIDIMDKPGLNFQWNYMEGFNVGFRDKPTDLIGEEKEPIIDYDGTVGSAVIGGYVYRGNAISSLYGKYVFGDNSNGSVYALTHTGGNTHGGLEEIGNVGGATFNGISSVGLTHDNEILILKLSKATMGGGKIFKVATGSSTSQEGLPTLLSEAGVFSDMQNLVPTDGIMPYKTNNPLWSSGTDKQRWVSIPQDGNVDADLEKIGYSEEGPWELPVGTVFIKQFDNPDGTKMETRLWIHGEDGQWFGSTYKWRADGMEADLLLEGASENITINGEAITYEYPSSNQCIQCHNPEAGWVLGFNTRQLNGDILYPTTGRTANQLETLSALGFIPEVDTENVLTSVPIEDNSASLEIRARSYFDSNCAYCHLPGSTRAEFDMRLSTPLAQQNIINGSIIEDINNNGSVAIAPGDISKSMVYHRMNTVDTEIMMPPLAKSTIDTEAMQLIEAWINSLDTNCDPEDAVVMGNSPVTDGDFIDGHSPHININRTDGYTNTTSEAVTICINDFTFYARRVGNPLTPFIAKVNSENDFTVISIGETRTATEYQIGSNTFNYTDHSSDAVTLQPGEGIAPGFMDAYPDGSGSDKGSSVIPAITGTGEDDVWQSYKRNDQDFPALVMGRLPEGSSIAAHLARSYQFNLGINISKEEEIPETENIAYLKTTTQSSDYFKGTGSSENAVDGNTDGKYSNQSVTHTHETSENPWWRVDLGDMYALSDIIIFNRTDVYGQNIMADRLIGASVLVGNSDSSDPQDYTEVGILTADIEQHFDEIAVSGRYVMIYLEGEAKILSLTEVQVYGEIVVDPEPIENLAYLKPTLQSSDFKEGISGTSDKAVDGNTDGIYKNSSVTHTIGNGSTNPWWRVDLGENYTIGDINIFNRTDSCCSDRLIGAKVLVGSLDSYNPEDYVEIAILNDNSAEYNLDAQGLSGRYVLVYLEGDSKILSLAEVQVYETDEIPETEIVTTLFQHRYFKGTSVALSVGAYPDISLLGFDLNEATSLTVTQGYTVELYPELNFEGTPLVLTADADDLVALGFDDDTESVKVFKTEEVEICQCESGEYSLLVNGSFEETSNPAYSSAYDLIEDLGRSNSGVKFVDKHVDTDFPGWFTTGGIYNPDNGVTSTGGTLELGQSGFLGVEAPDGNVFAEMDGNHHNQIVSVTPGQVMDWELSHRGRPGEDEVTISVGPAGAEPTVVGVVSSPNTEWVMHTGQYQVPEGITQIQFTITPSGAANGDMDSSNLLDFVKLCPSNTIVAAKLFEHVKYNGSSITLVEGEYPDLSIQALDNISSSIEITEGYQVELFSEANFGGNAILYTSDDQDFRNRNFNDLTSSLKITKYEALTAMSMTSEAALASNTTLFPNPASEYVIIYNPDDNNPVQNVGVYDLSGRAIETITINHASIQDNTFSINTTHYEQGLYMLRLEFLNGKIESHSLLVQ